MIDVDANRVDDPDDLVAGHHRPSGVGALALHGQDVAVADPAGQCSNPDLIMTGLVQLAFYETELTLPSDLVSPI
jgi:hypothetical protein